MSTTVIGGDCLAVLRDMPDASVDAIVTDPPYGLAEHKPAALTTALTAWVNGDRERVPDGKGFMGKDWDRFVPPPAVWDECLRVLKPGGHLVAFAGSRTVDLMGLSIRLAGFELRDGLTWLYGSGFPKSLDVSKAIDKAAGAERGPGVPYIHPRDGVPYVGPEQPEGDGSSFRSGVRAPMITAPATDAAQQWAGWGTALKPAQEPIVLARKPLAGTVAATVLAHGTGALNVDGCRVAGPKPDTTRGASAQRSSMEGGILGGQGRILDDGRGRWPSNVLLSHAPECGPEEAPGPCVPGCPVAELDAQSGNVGAAAPVRGTERSAAVEDGGITNRRGRVPGAFHGDSGGASRFFPVFRYQAKASTRERPKVDGVAHPTVKPLALMRWLVRLVTPPGGLVLDPFAGSGTTLQAARDEGLRAVGIEREPTYLPLIAARLGVELDTFERHVDEPAASESVDPVLAAIAEALGADDLDAIYDEHESVWCDEYTAAGRAQMAKISGVAA